MPTFTLLSPLPSLLQLPQLIWLHSSSKYSATELFFKTISVVALFLTAWFFADMKLNWLLLQPNHYQTTMMT
jgi:hypothetical protein